MKKYSDEVYDKATRELAERREAAQKELKQRELYVFEQLPEVREMRQNIKNSYLELVKIIATHDPDAMAAAELVKEKNLNTQNRIEILVEALTGDKDYLTPPYTCPDCEDTGYREGVRCRCLAELLKKYAAEELCLRSKIALHDFSQFRADFYPDEETRSRMTRLCSYFADYCEHFPGGCRSMLFMGKTGLGKTFLSSCIAKAVAAKGYAVVIGSAADMMRAMENEHFGRAEGTTLDTIIEADLAVLDDLGSEFSNPFYEACLYNIVNSRLNMKKVTIISTNLSDADFNRRYNERICSRVFNEYMPIVFSGRDIRQLKANRKFAGK